MVREIVCIIPAHNEGDRILNVIRAASDSDLFDRIVVVDDGSEDHTAWALESIFQNSRLTVLRIPRSVGKSRAVAHALTHGPRSRFVCLLDADLIGLRPEDLHALVKPVAVSEADVCLGRRGRGSGFWPGLDVLTGERVMPWWMIEAAELQNRSSMGMEMALNDVIIRTEAKVSVVHWPGVINPTKRQKYGFWRGIRKDFNMWRDLHAAGLRKLASQTWALNRQLGGHRGERRQTIETQTGGGVAR